MDVRQLADRVGGPGQHGVEREQLLDRHHLRGELELERARESRKIVFFRTRYEPARSAMATVIRVSISSTGSDMASIIATRIALAVEVLGLEEEPPPLHALHGERLDDLDPLEALLEDLVDRRHALERPPHGPLHDPADAVGRQRRDRHEDQRQAGQPPVQPEGPAQAEDDPQRLADQLAQQRDEPLAERVHVVGEPGHQLGRALVGEAAQVEVERAAEEEVADVELRQLHDVGDQDFLEEHEEALDRHADDDQAEQEQQVAEAVRGEIAVDRAASSRW